MILRIFAHEYNTEIMICNYNPPKVCEFKIHRDKIVIYLHSQQNLLNFQITTPKCRFTEQRGHKVAAPEKCSVVHTISADFAMCRGIGVQFNCKNSRVTEQLRQDKHTGNVAVLKDQDRFVYNLVTKERNHERGTYIALFYALIATRDHMV